MKSNPTLHDKIELNKLAKSGNDAVDRCLKLGLDIELRRVAVAVQYGRGAIGFARKLTRAQLIALGEREGGRRLPGLHGV